MKHLNHAETAIVTGANSGLGYEVTLQLAKQGYHVILACRTLEKAQLAAQQILQSYPSAMLSPYECDLADLHSVRLFSENLTENFPVIHLLVNNAGVMNLPFYMETADGFEQQFGINHLGHFALTGLVLPHLLKANHARVITVSSLWHKYAKLDFPDIFSKKSYTPRKAYCNSKLANLLFAFELQRRLSGTNVISVAAHPGYSNTHLQFVGFKIKQNFFKHLLYIIGNHLIAQSASQGALPILYAATNPSVKGGEYYGPDGIGEIRGVPRYVHAAAMAYDVNLAKQLWEISSDLTSSAVDPSLRSGQKKASPKKRKGWKPKNP